jgi:hypothetical protein
LRTDALNTFIPLNGALSLVGGSGAGFPSNTIDMLGQGVGQAPGNIIGTAPVWGADYGIGSDLLLLDIVVGAALVTATAATLSVIFQGAVDTGAAGGYMPGPWINFDTKGPYTAAQAPANTRLARTTWPPSFPENTTPPRYVRLLFQVSAGASFTAGTISYALATWARDDQANRFAARNYRV